MESDNSMITNWLIRQKPCENTIEVLESKIEEAGISTSLDALLWSFEDECTSKSREIGKNTVHYKQKYGWYKSQTRDVSKTKIILSFPLRRKVYSILSCQLLITFGIVAIFTFEDNINEYVHLNSWVFWVSFAMTLIVMIVLICAGDMRRQTPWNYIFLMVFTVFEGILIGCICAYAGTWAVSISVIATFDDTAELNVDFSGKTVRFTESVKMMERGRPTVSMRQTSDN